MGMIELGIDRANITSSTLFGIKVDGFVLRPQKIHLLRTEKKTLEDEVIFSSLPWLEDAPVQKYNK